MSGHESFDGYISRQHTIWCGDCGNWEQLDENKAKAVEQWRRKGWRLSKCAGWLCPLCARARGILK